MKRTFLFLALISLTACVPSTKEPYVPTVECEYDKFNDMTTCVLGTSCTKPPVSDKENCFWLLSKYYSTEKPDSFVALQGYIRAVDAIYADYAIDSDGNRFETTHNKFDVSCGYVCVTYEYITIKLDSDYTIRNATKGIEMKVYGTDGTSIINISPQYLEVFNNFLKGKGAKYE